MIKQAYLILFIILLFNISSKSQTSEDDSTLIDIYGQLSVNGTRIVNEHGDTIALRGISFFWSQWIGKYYTYDCVKWLRDDWKCMVVRAAMAVESGGYLTNPETEMNKVKTVIDAAIDLGIYVIIDWHDHHAHLHTNAAVDFFKEIATLYGNYPNIIYEIYNEPLGGYTWNDVIKPYNDTLVNAIREIDPDNIIIVGTPTWSQDVDVASNNPIIDTNIAYALHFYAATHKSWLRSKATSAMNNGIALFVSEYGTCESSGTGLFDTLEMNRWFKFMDDYMISWCNWSIADKDETSAALKSGASANGGWEISDLTESGIYVRNEIIDWYEQDYKPLPEEEEPTNYNIFTSRSNLIKIYPNPANSFLNFEFDISSEQYVNIEIFDILGNRIFSFFNNYLQPGIYTKSFNINNLKTGTYICKFQGKDIIQIERIFIVK
ncbi:MAG: cellulase family glycosylhydrolase [Bacteroidales bacterium]|nr:cellulase family glycosylhydrolase [Bacteroidales bacterium]